MSKSLVVGLICLMFYTAAQGQAKHELLAYDPHGTKLMYAAAPDAMRLIYYAYDRKSQARKRLTPQEKSRLEERWGAAGNMMAKAAQEADFLTLLPDSLQVAHFDYANNEQQVCFEASNSQGTDLFLLHKAEQSLQQLTALTGDCTKPAFVSDEVIVFHYHNEAGEVHLVQLTLPEGKLYSITGEDF